MVMVSSMARRFPTINLDCWLCPQLEGRRKCFEEMSILGLSLPASCGTPRLRLFSSVLCFLSCFFFKTKNSLVFQDIEAWVPPTPPGKVLLDSLAACAKVLFENGNGGGTGEGRRIAAARAADVMSRG